MFGHADARDGVERLVDDVTPVLHANVDKVGDTFVDHALARILGLLLGQRDTDRLNAVLSGRVHDERPHPHPTSSNRMPEPRPSFRQISSSLSRWASSREYVGSSGQAQYAQE